MKMIDDVNDAKAKRDLLKEAEINKKKELYEELRKELGYDS